MAAAESTLREPRPSPKKLEKFLSRKIKGKGKAILVKPSLDSVAKAQSSRDSVAAESDWEWYSLTEPSTNRFSPIFSRDGSFFFSLAGSSVKIHSVATGRIISTLSAPRHPGNQTSLDLLTSAIFNPHNAFQLITGSLDGRVIVWDFLDAIILQTIDLAQPIHFICAHEKWKDTVFVAASKDSNMDKNGVVLRISLKPAENSTKSSEILPIGKTGFPTGLALSSCATWLVATAGHKVYVAATSSPTARFTKYVSPDRLTCLAFHPSEQYFATGDDKGKIRLWYCLNDNLPVNIRGVEKKTQTVALHWHAHAVWSIAFTSNGAYLLSGGEESVLVIWQLHTGKKEFVPRVGAPISAISVFKTGEGSEQYLLGLADATYLVVNSGNLKVSKSYSSIKLDPRAYYTSPVEKISAPLAIHPFTSTLILPSSHPSSLQIFSPSTSTLVSELEVSPSNRVSRRDDKPLVHFLVEEATVSSSGDWLATVDTRESVDGFQGDNYLKFWSWDSNNNHWSLNTRIDRPHGLGKITNLAFSPPSKSFSTHLATAGEDRVVKIWGVRVAKHKTMAMEESWVTRAIFELRLEIPRSVDWSPDGSLLAVVFDSYVALYDPTSNVLRRALASPGVRLSKAVHFIGKAGRFLAVAGDHELVLWDLVSHSVLWNYKSHWRIDKVVPRVGSGAFTVFEDASTQDLRKTRVSIFDAQSPTPSKIHSLPFRLRNLLPYPWPHGSLGHTFVAITYDWRVVVFGKDVKPTEEGLSAKRITSNLGLTRNTLFQDIFGKSAFTKHQTTSTPVVPPQSHTKATRDVLDTPAYLAPPLEHLFDSLMDGFLKHREELPIDPMQEDDDIELDETPDVVSLVSRRPGRTISQEETDAVVRLFRGHSIGSALNTSMNTSSNPTVATQAKQSITPHQLDGKATLLGIRAPEQHVPVRINPDSDGVQDSTSIPTLSPLHIMNGQKRQALT